jgi:hypothetical protein
MPHAMFMWLVTIGRYRLQPDLQPHDITLESVRRTCQAAVDLDSLDAIAADDGHRILSTTTERSRAHVENR